jgi:putative ABC transport system substrate-binding protein
MKSRLWIILAVIVIVAVAGYSIYAANRGPDPSQTVKIGISQLVPHVVLDAVREEILTTLSSNGYEQGENLVVDYQNAQGDENVNQSIAQKFAASDYDLFVAITTPSSQALVKAIKDRPIIFAAVSDPLKAELVSSLENPGGNVTGTSDITLYEEQLGLIKKLQPNAKKIGIIYNPSEIAAQSGLEQAQKFGTPLEFEFVTTTVSTTNEVLAAARSLTEKVDVFYIIPDNTVIAGQDALIKVAIEAKKPLFAYEQSGVESGALATLSTNYTALGKKTAEMVIRVLEGKKPGNIAVVGITEADLFVNKKTADAIGLSLPTDLINDAKEVYE